MLRSVNMASNKHKVIIVTGGGSGMGQATVVEFAKGGYNVVITGRTMSKLETTADMCKSEGLTDDNILLFAGDITKPEDNARAITETLAKFNRLDVLVNNAGHTVATAFGDDSPLELLDEMYNVYVRGVVDITQQAMPHLLKTKGNVIIVSATALHFPEYLAYFMMKAAIDHFTRAISVDYAPKGVRVNSVNPGATRTTTLDDLLPADQVEAVWESYGKAQPIGKCLQPRDVAKTIFFLASDDASFITGANLPVDGAWRNTMALPV